jgi:predicted unusual protein kinase regulating ubiquinone biosynthesis (AarF/ABC1/UbiB family)
MKNKIIKQLFFIIKLFYIILSELTIYYFYKNYKNFIHNITHRLACINILYVKLFQAVALNNNYIDDVTNIELLKFTDNAPWCYSDINLSDIIQVSNDFNLDLKYGYEVPINSGMISLIFKAYDKKSGKPMIIKMKRNNIEIQLNDAISNLEMFLYILSFIPIINKYHIIDVVNKNIYIIKQQTNFTREVENIQKIKNNCINLKYVKIPDVFKEVTEKYPDIILMEYIDGMKINQLHEDDYTGFAEQIIKFGVVTTIVHGVTHGDLHGGNILFIKDLTHDKYKYKIGIIDFGIIYELDSEYKKLLFDIFTQLFSISSRESAIKLLNSGIIDPPGILQEISHEHYENIINFTSDIIEETINNSKKANQMQLYKFLINLNDYLNNHELNKLGIKPSNNFVKTQLVLAMAHGVTLTLCKNDFILMSDKVINELFHTNLLS